MPDKEKLQQIVDDPATLDSERREAQVELNALEPSTTLSEGEERAASLCGPIALELLRFVGVRDMQEVSWRDLIRFTESREWPGKWHDSSLKSLWNSWIVWGCPDFRQRIWDAIKEKFKTDPERRAEFERMSREYPVFELTAIDDPCELEMYERHLNSSDRNSILAITRKKLDEAPEYAFKTRQVAQRIIAKLTEKK